MGGGGGGVEGKMRGTESCAHPSVRAPKQKQTKIPASLLMTLEPVAEMLVRLGFLEQIY